MDNQANPLLLICIVLLACIVAPIRWLADGLLYIAVGGPEARR